jgi:hypothetical protein
MGSGAEAIPYPSFLAEVTMPDRESVEDDILPEISKFSDRLMVILGEAVMEEIEKAESEGGNLTALQFGTLDALTKHLSGALTACVTMVRKLTLSQNDFIALRQRIYEQLEPAVLALMRQEVAKAGGEGDLPWAYGHTRTGHA